MVDYDLFNRMIPTEIRWYIYLLHEKDYVKKRKNVCIEELMHVTNNIAHALHVLNMEDFCDTWKINNTVYKKSIMSPKTCQWMLDYPAPTSFVCSMCFQLQWHIHLLNDWETRH
jgi:hypothetical protein